MIDGKRYDAAWKKVRAERNYPPLSDELLWHHVFREYINSLSPVERSASREALIEGHLRILGPIAGRIAWKRCPRSFGIWVEECAPHLSHVGLVHELAAFGVLALFIAADRYEPNKGAFSTYANFWIKKFVSLYLEEIIGTVPRTGHKGESRISVMDRVDAALEGRRLYRGKTSGGMTLFDEPITISGPYEGDKEIETVDADGCPTDPTGLDYLQRRVGKKLYPWRDTGTYLAPRLELPGHPGGRASVDLPRDVTYELDDEIELPVKPAPFEHTGPSMTPAPPPLTFCWRTARGKSVYKRADEQQQIPRDLQITTPDGTNAHLIKLLKWRRDAAKQDQEQAARVKAFKELKHAEMLERIARRLAEECVTLTTKGYQEVRKIDQDREAESGASSVGQGDGQASAQKKSATG